MLGHLVLPGDTNPATFGWLKTPTCTTSLPAAWLLTLSYPYVQVALFSVCEKLGNAILFQENEAFLSTIQFMQHLKKNRVCLVAEKEKQELDQFKSKCAQLSPRP